MYLCKRQLVEFDIAAFRSYNGACGVWVHQGRSSGCNYDKHRVTTCSGTALNQRCVNVSDVDTTLIQRCAISRGFQGATPKWRHGCVCQTRGPVRSDTALIFSEIVTAAGDQIQKGSQVLTVSLFGIHGFSARGSQLGNKNYAVILQSLYKITGSLGHKHGQRNFILNPDQFISDKMIQNKIGELHEFFTTCIEKLSLKSHIKKNCIIKTDKWHYIVVRLYSQLWSLKSMFVM